MRICGRPHQTYISSGRALCRPRKQRTYKYHANVHPLQGAAPCGSPQAVMIHNLLVGCRNLCSSLEEAHSSVTPGKAAQRTQPGDSRKQRNSASKRLTSISDAYIRTTSIRSLEEAHSSVTPGKDAQRTQPGDSREQGNRASKRLANISDAYISTIRAAGASKRLTHP